MRLIAPTLHRILDFITVALFAVAPALLHLTGVAAVLSCLPVLIPLTILLMRRVQATETQL